MKHEVILDTTMTVRNLHLGGEPIGAGRWYMGGDPVATAFYNALTIVFPPGERFFIESVRAFRRGSPPQLSREIADFIRQEALHTREHEAFNEQVRTGGYDTAASEDRTNAVLDKERRKSAIAQLGFTISLEHFTAVLANEMLCGAHHMASAPDSVRRLWHWHALEEIEHKAVTFDTYLWAAKDWTPVKRWAYRNYAMVSTTWTFFANTSANMMDLLEQDGITGFSAYRRAFTFVFGKRGIGRGVMRHWFAWFKPGYHPWDDDNRELIKGVAAQFAPDAA